jgi:hypothetical protein
MKRVMLHEIRDSDEFRQLVSISPHTLQMFNFNQSEEDLDRIKPADFEKLILDKRAMIDMLLRSHTQGQQSRDS